VAVDRGEPAADGGAEPSLASLRATLARAVSAVCPAWLAERADDIVQEAMLKVLAVRGRGEGIAALPPSYLRKVAWTATVDEIRRRAARREDPVDAIETQAMSPPAETESTAIRNELLVGVRDCLERIVLDRRRAVALHLAGWSIPEVAAALEWPAKRAENLVYRGLADLRACLQKKGIAP
jgi:RNA polymerase sigma-70 factor (ECF subfamily)